MREKKNGSYGTNGNYGDENRETPSVLRARGDDHTLLSYQKAEVIYEITYCFCRRLLMRGDRTIDQMIQAARSGECRISSKGARQL